MTSPKQSLDLIFIIVSALLSVPSLLTWFYLTGAAFPNVFVADTYLGVSLIVFCLWLILAVGFGFKLLRIDNFHPKALHSFLLLTTSLSAFGFLRAYGSEWVYFSLPAVSSILILWQANRS